MLTAMDDAVGRIKQALNEQKGNVTMVCIAHRLSTVIEADKVFVFERGKIVEQGKPRELLDDKDSKFYKLANTE